MLVFGMFNIVMLAIGLLELGFIVVCLVSFIVGCFLRSKAMVITSLAVPALFIGLSFVISYASELQNPFPYLKEPPVERLVPGTYVLDPSSFDYLKSRGFNDLSATIVLNEDKTFNVTRMPHIWIDGSPESSGYDTCAGRWSLGQNAYDHTFNVTLEADKTTFPMGAVFLDIFSPKGKRKDYALSVPIFYGDFDYIYFVRNTN